MVVFEYFETTPRIYQSTASSFDFTGVGIGSSGTGGVGPADRCMISAKEGRRAAEAGICNAAKDGLRNIALGGRISLSALGVGIVSVVLIHGNMTDDFLRPIPGLEMRCVSLEASSLVILVERSDAGIEDLSQSGFL